MNPPRPLPAPIDGPTAKRHFLTCPADFEKIVNHIYHRLMTNHYGCQSENVRRMLAMALDYMQQP